ncbi:MAG: aspartyl protease family protein [Treponema sp.]|jgi:clan AA aspartic protease|nr:aspartyl protease family protein [Treponema sp.]
MGLVHENITLKNAFDVRDCRRGIIAESQVRQVNIQAMVDTGAETLVINEVMRQELGLEVMGEQWVRMANEASCVCKFTEPVEIHWKDRSSIIRAFVLDGSKEVLLGAIPLEDMNVMVDPGGRRLVGINGDKIIFKI